MIFCSKCGVKNNADDKFCKDCGAKLSGSTDSPKEEARTEQPSAPTQSPAPAPVTPVKIPVKTQIHAVVQAIVSLFILGLVGYFLWYSYNCVVGNNRGNGDVACQSMYNFFNSSGTYVAPGGNKNGNNNPYCINRCPANAPYYCTGQYYDSNGIQRSLNGCLPTTASQAGYSSWTGTCVKPTCN